jgi:hypothetical protein
VFLPIIFAASKTPKPQLVNLHVICSISVDSSSLSLVLVVDQLLLEVRLKLLGNLNFDGVELSILVWNTVKELLDHDRLHHDGDHHASDEELSTEVGVQPLVAAAGASQIITLVDVDAS